jgi:hypothetical protein
VDINEESRSAIAVVPDRQLSLAIGKEGQNARLAAKLTGWKVDISSHLEATTQPVVTLAPEPVATVVEEQPVEVEVAAEPVLAEATVADETAAEDSAVVEVQAVDIEVQTVDIAEDAEEVVVETAATVDEEDQSEEPSDDELLAQLEAIEAAEESAVDDDQEVGVPEELLPTDEELGILVEEELEEPLPVLGAPRISDLSEDVWSLRRSGSESELGQIRFAEDIAGLRGGITASRGRRRGPANDQDRNRRRKRRAGTRRRTRR